jgi:hypothetical protein
MSPLLLLAGIFPGEDEGSMRIGGTKRFVRLEGSCLGEPVEGIPAVMTLFG